MRISPINTIKSNQTQNYANTNKTSSNLMSFSQDRFSPGFKGMNYSFKNLQKGIAHMDPTELSEFAKTLTKASDHAIKKACLDTIDGSFWFGKLCLLDDIKRSNYNFRVTTVMTAVTKERANLSYLEGKLYLLKQDPGKNAVEIAKLETEVSALSEKGRSGIKEEASADALPYCP